MAVNYGGFVEQPQSFEGIDKLTNTLRIKEQQRLYDERDQQSRKASSTKFFSNYLDQKAKFTGTKYDPYTHELTSVALNQAMDLIKEGANDSDIMAAISPLVNKASKYTLNAQAYSKNKTDALARLKGVKGIDQEKLSNEIDRMAFDGKDIAEVDPSINYADMALKDGDVYNTEGFDEAFTKAPKNTEISSIKFTNARGGNERARVKLTAPYYAISEKDKEGNHIGFVPKYQTATDQGNELIQDFETENGNVKAPIRLYDKELFNAMPPEEKAYVLQEARKFAKEKGVQLSSVQAENFARAIAYDEKKGRINGTYEHVEETKQNPIRIYTGGGGGKLTQAEKKAMQSASDLKEALDSEPEAEDGTINVSKYINGVTFLTNSKGKRISQPEVLFNPKEKTFTYTDDEGKQETVSFPKFKSIATPVNTASDLGFLEGFRGYNRGANSPKKQPEPPDEIKGNTKSFFQKITNGVFGKPKQPEKKKEAVDPLDILGQN